MDSKSMSQVADDICLAGTDELFALPIRSRPGRVATEDVVADQDMEDDYDIVSAPGSVRSFDSPSPTPESEQINQISSPSLSQDEAQPIPSKQCSCGQRMPPFAPCIKCSGSRPNLALPSITCPPQTRGTLSQFSERRSLRTSYSFFPLPSVRSPEHEESIPGAGLLALPSSEAQSSAIDDQPGCHDHESLDKAIMDQLIGRAIESHSKAEGQDGTLTNSQLAMKMLVRLLKLPPDHGVSQELVKLQPTQFHPVYREATQRRAIFEKVFTDIERAALYSIIQSHKCNFKQHCVFADCLHADTNWLSSASPLYLHRAGRLASEVQMVCVNSASRTSLLSLLSFEPRCEWPYMIFSTIKARCVMLREGSDALRAGVHAEILYHRYPDAKYQFRSGSGGFDSIEAMVIVETLNKALPDLAELKQLHMSRTIPVAPVRPSARIKREASAEDLSSNGLCSPPLKKVSLPQGDCLPNLSAPFYYSNPDSHQLPMLQSTFTPSGESRCAGVRPLIADFGGPIASLHLSPGTMERLGNGQYPAYCSLAEVRRFDENLKISVSQEDARNLMAQGFVGPPWRKPIADYDGSIESLGLHRNTLEALRSEDSPSFVSLSEVQRLDKSYKRQEIAYEQRLLVQQQQHQQVLQKQQQEIAYQQQLLVQKQQSQRRCADRRAEEEQKHESMQCGPYQLALLELQNKKRLAMAREEMEHQSQQQKRVLVVDSSVVTQEPEQAAGRQQQTTQTQPQQHQADKDRNNNQPQLTTPPQDYQMQLQMLELQNRKRLAMHRKEGEQHRKEEEQKDKETVAQQDYQMHLAALEAQNKNRLRLDLQWQGVRERLRGFRAPVQPHGMNRLILPEVQSSKMYGPVEEERRERSLNRAYGPLTKTATQCKGAREKDRVERSRNSKAHEQIMSRELGTSQKSTEPTNGQEQKTHSDVEQRRCEEVLAKLVEQQRKKVVLCEGTAETVAEKMDTDETKEEEKKDEVDQNMRAEKEHRGQARELQNHQMQLMLLEAQNKRRLAPFLQKEEVKTAPTEDPPHVVDYSNQLKILEARNQLRLTIARHEDELQQYSETIGAKVREIDTWGLDTDQLVTLLKMLRERCLREAAVREAHGKKRESLRAYQDWLLLLDSHNMKTMAEDEQMEGLKRQAELQAQTEGLVLKSPEMQKKKPTRGGCGQSEARRLCVLRKKRESEETARIEAAERAGRDDSDLERKVW